MRLMAVVVRLYTVATEVDVGVGVGLLGLASSSSGVCGEWGSALTRPACLSAGPSSPSACLAGLWPSGAHAGRPVTASPPFLGAWARSVGARAGRPVTASPPFHGAWARSLLRACFFGLRASTGGGGTARGPLVAQTSSSASSATSSAGVDPRFHGGAAPGCDCHLCFLPARWRPRPRPRPRPLPWAACASSS